MAIRSMSNLTKNFKKYDLDIKGVRLPSFEISPEEKERVGTKKDCDNLTFLTALCSNQLKVIKKKVTPEKYKQYVQRTKYELKILKCII